MLDEGGLDWLRTNIFVQKINLWLRSSVMLSWGGIGCAFVEGWGGGGATQLDKSLFVLYVAL